MQVRASEEMLAINGVHVLVSLRIPDKSRGTRRMLESHFYG